ncbi:putative transporter [Podospora conica]|nr:putative transporter [Schizothecium conicum]
MDFGGSPGLISLPGTSVHNLAAATTATAAAALTQDGGKPLCGSGEDPGEYDLPLHVAALFIVLAASAFGAGFPVAAMKLPWLKVPTKAFFMCKHFGTGVLIATAFVHLLPVAFGNLTNPCLPDLFTDQYPAMPGVIMMASMFCLFVLEMWLNNKMGGHAHSHGPTTGFSGNTAPAHHHDHNPTISYPVPPPRPPRYTVDNFDDDDEIEYEKKVARKMYEEKLRNGEDPFADSNEVNPSSEMPAWFIVFYEQYVRQRLELVNMIKGAAPAGPAIADKRRTFTPPAALADSPYRDPETGMPVDPLVYKKMAMNISLLEGGILFHSVFVGMTISITIDGFIILLVAIVFHQMFEGLGLGSRIAAVPYKKGSIRPWVLVGLFATTCPIGQAIGLMMRNAYDPESALGLIMVGVFNAISSGLLLYAALVDLLAEDFLSEEANRTLTSKDKKLAFAFVLLGALAMSIVGAFA